jgi:hypothetical protein
MITMSIPRIQWWRFSFAFLNETLSWVKRIKKNMSLLSLFSSIFSSLILVPQTKMHSTTEIEKNQSIFFEINSKTMSTQRNYQSLNNWKSMISESQMFAPETQT